MNLDFDKIPKYCISLQRSTERREFVQREFVKAGLNVTFFDAIDRNDLILPELSIKENKTAIHKQGTGILACMLSHKYLYEQALNNGHDAICVFEDDVILADDFMQRIRYMENLPNFNFHFISLGAHFAADELGSMKNCAEQTQWNRIYRTIAAGGSYAYIITKEVMEFCVRNLYYNFGMDEFLSEHVYKRFACYSFVPFLASVRPCVSEIAGVYWDYKAAHVHYQQEPIENLNEAFINPLDREKEQSRIAADAARELRLKNER